MAARKPKPARRAAGDGDPDFSERIEASDASDEYVGGVINAHVAGGPKKIVVIPDDDGEGGMTVSVWS